MDPRFPQLLNRINVSTQHGLVPIIDADFILLSKHNVLSHIRPAQLTYNSTHRKRHYLYPYLR